MAPASKCGSRTRPPQRPPRPRRPAVPRAGLSARHRVWARTARLLGDGQQGRDVPHSRSSPVQESLNVQYRSGFRQMSRFKRRFAFRCRSDGVLPGRRRAEANRLPLAVQRGHAASADGWACRVMACSGSCSGAVTGAEAGITSAFTIQASCSSRVMAACRRSALVGSSSSTSSWTSRMVLTVCSSLAVMSLAVSLVRSARQETAPAWCPTRYRGAPAVRKCMQ